MWQEGSRWSLGVPPDSQTTGFITNATTKTVTINSSTPAGNLTITELTLSGPGATVNTLQLTNLGAATPLRISNGFTINSGGALLVTGSVVRVDGAHSGQSATSSY